MNEFRPEMVAIFAPSAEETYDADGFPVSSEKNIFGEGTYYPCFWKDEASRGYGNASRYNAKKSATVKLKYHPEINEACKLYLAGDNKPFDIISVITDGRRYEMTLKVERLVRTI